MLVRFSEDHGIHRGDIGIVSFWSLGMIGVLVTPLARPKSTHHSEQNLHPLGVRPADVGDGVSRPIADAPALTAPSYRSPRSETWRTRARWLNATTTAAPSSAACSEAQTQIASHVDPTRKPPPT